jgi:hypothetical protein
MQVRQMISSHSGVRGHPDGSLLLRIARTCTSDAESCRRRAEAAVHSIRAET